MFDLGAQELVVIFVVALLVFGPKRLPELARTMGKGIGQLKKAVFDIKSQVDAEIKDAEGDIREQVPAWKDVASKFPDLAAERDALRDTLGGGGESPKTGEADSGETKREGDAPGSEGEGVSEEGTPTASDDGLDKSGGLSESMADELHARETDTPCAEEPPPKESSA